MAKTVAAATLGCKVNFVETEGVLELFRKAGYEVVDFTEPADVYVINTCAVTNESSKKSRRMIAKAKKHSPNAIIAVIGCYSELEPGKINADVVIGTSDRTKVVGLVEKLVNNVTRTKCGEAAVPGATNFEKPQAEQTIEFEELPIERMTGRTRAFVKIQDGCESYCAYCIIPYARGRFRSRPLKAVVEEVVRLAAFGCKEVVLTGINLTAYEDGNRKLLDVVEAVCAVDAIQRVRLGSLDPAFVTEEFARGLQRAGTLGYPVELATPVKQSKVCPHFHLPLQSGSSSVLKRMNRNYDTKQFEMAAGVLRAAFPGANITTDVIAGFPGETEAEFEECYAFIETIAFGGLHVFPYSKREGTAAAKMLGQVPLMVKKERAKRLIELGDRLAGA